MSGELLAAIFLLSSGHAKRWLTETRDWLGSNDFGKLDVE
jgi:hypothetical protein